MSVAAIDASSRVGNNEIDFRENMPHDLKYSKYKLSRCIYSSLLPESAQQSMYSLKTPASSHSLSV